MATESSERSIHENTLSQAFLWPAYWAGRLLFLFLTLLLAAWAAYLVAMHYQWGAEHGIQTTRDILAHDLSVIAHIGGQNSDTTRLAVGTANFLYWLIWETTRIHEAMAAFSDPTPRGALDTFLRNVLLVPFQSEVYVLMDATKIFGIRLAVFCTAIPLYLLCYVAGAVDGLVQRYIRRAGAGRESSSLYHRAKYFQMGGAAFLGLIYVSLPLAVDPRWVLLPSAGLLAILARVQWTYFKKYL